MLPVILFILLLGLAFGEKLYVVERERSALAVVEEGKLLKEIGNLGNLNHAVVKFWKGYGYVVSRDGFLSKIDLERDEVVKKVRVGKSSTGLDFTETYIVVANYDPETVVILDEGLNLLREIKTGSRNVGIKAYGEDFLFSLMDKDQVWWIKGMEEYMRFEVGKMPFDALLYGDHYLVGFFKEDGVGLIELNKKTYKKLSFKKKGEEVVFKIPHFGTWGVYEGLAYIPAVGEKKLYVVSLRDMKLVGEIALLGLPVFVAISPDGKYLAVNFSGDREDYITLIDREGGETLRELTAGKRVMHLRFSKDGKKLFISSYFESKVRSFDVPSLKLLYEVDVPNPSGVFLAR
jgi:protein NirF